MMCQIFQMEAQPIAPNPSPPPPSHTPSLGNSKQTQSRDAFVVEPTLQMQEIDIMDS